MPDLPWLALLLFAAFLSLFFTVSSARLRRTLFVIQCAIGAGVGLYGFWSMSGDAPYFKNLGLPLSSIVIVSLCFATLTVERLFSAAVLKKQVYPILSWYFVSWIGLAFLTNIWKLSASPPLWNFVFPIVMIAAFVSAGVSGFRLLWFQIFLPVLFILFLVALAESYVMALFGAASESIKTSFEQSATVFTKPFLEGNVWGLFHLFAYLFLCTKANTGALKQNFFSDKLPMTGVALAVLSFVSQFPEFETLRKLLPMQPRFADYGLISLDLVLIPIFLFSSGWPYDRRNLYMTTAALASFLAGTVLVTVSYSNPFGTMPDQAALQKIEKTVESISSWNIESATKSLGVPFPEKGYMQFAEVLGKRKQHHPPDAKVYTVLYVPLLASVSYAIVSVDTVFGNGMGTFYVLMAKTSREDWLILAVELYVGDYFMRIFKATEKQVKELGRRGWTIIKK